MSEQSPESQKSDTQMSKEMVALPDAEKPAYLQFSTFEQLGGLEEQIAVLRTAVMKFDDPDFFAEYDIQRPNGILIVGEGGTGKTHLANAFARELRAELIEINVSDIVDKWVGQSNVKIVKMFDDARDRKERVVLLFNEIDGLFGNDAVGNPGLQNSMIAEMKTIMENLHNTHPNVIVLGTSNSTSGFDPALLRPGRFDEIVQIPKPDHPTRISILGKMISKNYELYDIDPSSPDSLEDLLSQGPSRGGLTSRS